MTQPEEGDPLGHKYGDTPLVQSQAVTGRKLTAITDLTPELQGQTVCGHQHDRGWGVPTWLTAPQWV